MNLIGTSRVFHEELWNLSSPGNFPYDRTHSNSQSKCSQNKQEKNQNNNLDIIKSVEKLINYRWPENTQNETNTQETEQYFLE